ncbi:MAG: hypothetical protein IPJ32_02690 [Sphingobacteriaceae bacterium]|nr:hypothetical protein [Sphingobacteriaceae bacterium]
METSIDNSFEQAMQEPKRPQLLTVICILGFIMCGIGLLSGVWNIIQNTPENMAESIEKMRDFSPEMADKMEENMMAMQDNVYMQVSPYLNFVYILLSFMGILMMWKLQKKGFYLYLAGEILPYLGFIVAGKETMAMMGSAGGGAGEIAGFVVVGLMLLFDAAFVIMYAVNLKRMN